MDVASPSTKKGEKESESLSSWTYWRSLISIAPPLFSRERKAKSILLWGQLLVSGFFGAYIMSFLGQKCMKLRKKNRNSSLVVFFFRPCPVSQLSGFIMMMMIKKTNEHCTLWRLENPACLDSSTASDATPPVTEKISLHEFAGDSVASHNLEGGVEGGQVFHTLTTDIPICKYDYLYIWLYMIFTDSPLIAICTYAVQLHNYRELGKYRMYTIMYIPS